MIDADAWRSIGRVGREPRVKGRDLQLVPDVPMYTTQIEYEIEDKVGH